MTDAYESAMSTGNDDSVDEGEQLDLVTVPIPKALHVRAWRAKILKNQKIQDLISRGLDNELRDLGL